VNEMRVCLKRVNGCSVRLHVGHTDQFWRTESQTGKCSWSSPGSGRKFNSLGLVDSEPLTNNSRSFKCVAMESPDSTSHQTACAGSLSSNKRRFPLHMVTIYFTLFLTKRNIPSDVSSFHLIK
jgi:hypothetical protein